MSLVQWEMLMLAFGDGDDSERLPLVCEDARDLLRNDDG